MSDLTLPMMRMILNRYSYKPGWTFRVYEHRMAFDNGWQPLGNPELWIEISATLPDSYHPDSTTDLCIRSPVPPVPDEVAFMKWLNWRLKRIEMHEVDEWGKLDGKVIFDPHAADFNDG